MVCVVDLKQNQASFSPRLTVWSCLQLVQMPISRDLAIFVPTTTDLPLAHARGVITYRIGEFEVEGVDRSPLYTIHMHACAKFATKVALALNYIEKSLLAGGIQIVKHSRNLSMSKNTKEYRTLMKARDNFVLAIGHNVITLGAELFAEGLISMENVAELQNLHVSCYERASNLVSLIADRVELDPVNYHTFVRILAKNQATFKDILEYLDLKFHPEDDVAGNKAKYEDHSTALSTTRTGLLIIIL